MSSDCAQRQEGKLSSSPLLDLRRSLCRSMTASMTPSKAAAWGGARRRMSGRRYGLPQAMMQLSPRGNTRRCRRCHPLLRPQKLRNPGRTSGHRSSRWWSSPALEPALLCLLPDTKQLVSPVLLHSS